jgi:uncharacterized delta-60 repeat protein
VAAPAGGGSSISSADCSIAFGSSDGTAMLHVYQADAGGSALSRPSTGDLDDGFAGDGHVDDDHSAGGDEYRGVAIQPDGKVVVAAIHGTGTEMYVRRYLPDGQLDPTFGSGGETMLAGTYDTRDLALAPDGSIFVVGYGASRVQVAKLTTGGQLDPTWNGGTWTNHYFSSAAGSGIAAESIAMGPGGEVFVAGYTDLLGGTDVAVLNYTADGRLDASFDGDGVNYIEQDAFDEARGIAVQADGSVVIAGLADNATHDFAVARMRPDGSLDTSFAGDGVRRHPAGREHPRRRLLQCRGGRPRRRRRAGDAEWRA